VVKDLYVAHVSDPTLVASGRVVGHEPLESTGIKPIQ